MKKMKRISNCFAVLALICACLLGTQVYAAAMSENPLAGNGNGKGNGKGNQTVAVNAPLYGRFEIPSQKISVALYNSSSQEVCNAEDAACIYYLRSNQGMTIADHAYQTFKKLPKVTVGTTATIVLNDGGIIHLQCVEAYDGYNKGADLTDENGNVVTGTHDFITYCCKKAAGEITIRQWDIVYTEGIDPVYNRDFRIDARTNARMSLLCVA